MQLQENRQSFKSYPVTVWRADSRKRHDFFVTQETNWSCGISDNFESPCASSSSTASSEHGGIPLSAWTSEHLDSEESVTCETPEVSQADPRTPSLDTTEESCGGLGGEAEQVQRPTLHSDGPQRSIGSELHDLGGCVPCAFYCFKKQGCGNGSECNFCHMGHISNKKLRQQEWRKKQHEQNRKQRRASKKTSEDRDRRAAEHMAKDARDCEIVSPTHASKPDEEQNTRLEKPVHSISSFLGSHLGEPCFIEISSSGCNLVTQLCGSH